MSPLHPSLARMATAQLLIEWCCRYFGVAQPWRSRARMYNPCKRACVSALRTLGLSYPEVARAMLWHNHTSAMHHEQSSTAEDHFVAFEAICEAAGEST